MKKLLLIAIALITVNATAQEKKERKERQRGDRTESVELMKDLSPEKTATLQTKRMALHLDLTDAQQKEIHAIHLEQVKARKAVMETHKKLREENKEAKPSKDDRFYRANSQLDNKIAVKTKMKKILNKEQFEKWEQGNNMKGKQKTIKCKREGQQKMTRKRNQRN